MFFNVPKTISEENDVESDQEFEDLDDLEDLQNNDSFQLCENVDVIDLTEKQNINKTISKVRQIVRMFRKSPTKNDILQRYIKAEHKKELKLILDCKTRWSSLVDMLQRFVLVQNSVKKSLIDLRIDSLSDLEFKHIEEVACILQPVKVTVEALCARNMDLYKCDVALNFMLEEVKKFCSQLAKELYKKLLQRIIERRTILSDIFSFLNSPSKNLKGSDGFSQSLSLKRIKSEIQNILLNITNESIEENESSEDDEVTALDFQVNLKDKLNLLLNQSPLRFPNRTNYNMKNVLMKEIDIYINGGDKGFYLQKAFEYLSTIQPTSVEAERCFSSSGYICNKYRCRLEDKTFNALIFLRSYFKKTKTD